MFPIIEGILLAVVPILLALIWFAVYTACLLVLIWFIVYTA